MTEKNDQMKRYTTVITSGCCYAYSSEAHVIAGILMGITEYRQISIKPRGDSIRNSDWVIEQYCSAEQYRTFIEKMDRLYVDNSISGHKLICFDPSCEQ